MAATPFRSHLQSVLHNRQTTQDTLGSHSELHGCGARTTTVHARVTAHVCVAVSQTLGGETNFLEHGRVFWWRSAHSVVENSGYAALLSFFKATHMSSGMCVELAPDSGTRRCVHMFDVFHTDPSVLHSLWCRAWELVGTAAPCYRRRADPGTYWTTWVAEALNAKNFRWVDAQKRVLARLDDVHKSHTQYPQNP